MALIRIGDTRGVEPAGGPRQYWPEGVFAIGIKTCVIEHTKKGDGQNLVHEIISVEPGFEGLSDS